MTPIVDWRDIALRLLLAAVASAAIGINRGEQEKPVGLRTTMLVTLAAAIAMVQVNLLLPVAGKAANSFVVMDLMRLPLGILSGMGFGAGAIIRRGNLVQGVTTAATLWFATVMGLCFGGGQFALGLASLGFAVFILWPLKRAEQWLAHERRGTLSITTANSAAEPSALSRFTTAGFRVRHRALSLVGQGKTCTMSCEVRWYENRLSRSPIELVRELGHEPEVIAVEWKPLDSH